MTEIIETEQTFSKDTTDFVTVEIAGQMFGIPVNVIHDVFMPDFITEVPLAPKEIGGVLNLRGRIVTAIDIRDRLGFPARERGESCMAVGIERNGESYGLIIDSVGDVLSLDKSAFERNPANLDPRWRQVSVGVFRMDEDLLVILDVNLALEFDTNGVQAA